MIFTETRLRGAFIVEPERIEDERGFFARSFCSREFKEKGLDAVCVQSNISFNKMKRTLRGMHYQIPPHAEAKLVRCTMGSIFDVIIDLRPSSNTYLHWISVELTAQNRRQLFIAAGFAHGFLTLEDETEVSYQMSEFYAPGSARGIRWDDPLFAIEWPASPLCISPKDQQYLPFVR
jgi:dTDP-4-dehydrorhamnose 3,5-epimerase